MIVYLGNNITKTKIDLYKYMLENVEDLRGGHISVLLDMYEKYNIENKDFIYSLIKQLEEDIYKEIRSNPYLFKKLFKLK